MKVNLHSHSTISDGLLTPKELVQKFVLDGVEIAALTDHDRIDGLAEAYHYAKEYGLNWIHGIEISASIHDLEIPMLDTKHHTLHLLGLGFNLESMQHHMIQRKMEKMIRIKVLIDQLRNDGYDININNGVFRKTDIAIELVNKGYCTSIQDAFESIINHYYDRNFDNLSIMQSVDLIHRSGGKILWAHPYDILFDMDKQRIDDGMVEQIAIRLKSLGVDGLEVYYQKFDEHQQSFLKTLQNQLNMIASCGTDYHGKPSQTVTFMEIDPLLIKEVIG